MRLTNSWKLVPRRGKKKGLDLLIQPGEAIGASAATWNETPATDLTPILLPWTGKKQELWIFENDLISGG
jgi:hypothetical protein